jgi:DNA topoisomerase VI subunit B
MSSLEKSRDFAKIRPSEGAKDPMDPMASQASENPQKGANLTKAGSGIAPQPMGSAVSANPPKAPILTVRRLDTRLFGTLQGLTNMAGVPPQLLRRLIVKEAVDNALDEMDRIGGDATSVTVSKDGDNTYVVTDGGSGIEQDLDKLRDLFSTSRPMVTGKFLRRPSRGTLGNGLRVLVGAVALSEARISVQSHGQRTTLRPKISGITEVLAQESVPPAPGTRIEFSLGAIIPRDDRDLIHAERAIRLAKKAGQPFKRLSSPHWQDFDHLAEICATIEAGATVRQLLAGLDGCASAKAGRKLAAPFGKERTCRNLREAEIAALLTAMQASARVVKAKALGPIGPDAFGEAFDGYSVAQANLRIGAHRPYANIPVLIEAFASVSGRRSGNASLAIYANRTPVVGYVNAVRGQGGIRVSGTGLDEALVKVEGGEAVLILAVTAPFIPTTSMGKAPDLSRLETHIVEALRKAFVKSRNLVPPDPAQPKLPKDSPLPKRPKPEPYQPTGPLAIRLDEEAEQAGLERRDLLVLSNDPFDETRAIRRMAEWFAEQVRRFVREDRKVHSRGVYYMCLSAGDVRLPNGTLFVGSYKNAKFVEIAAKYARYLGLVDFERIVDERSAEAEPHVYDEHHIDASKDPIHHALLVADGREPDKRGPLAVPELDRLLPKLAIDVPQVPRQPYRIVLIGEKVSLGAVLRPIAIEVQGEMLLATGEVSDTRVFEILRRAQKDGRPLIILYFSDFDPAGWRMPISVSRKLQALIGCKFPGLKVKLYRVGLTIDQVKEFNLPDSPIKPGEPQALAWLERWWPEKVKAAKAKGEKPEGGQVEIDALAALRPKVLEQIAWDAVAPFFDPTFERRYTEAVEMPEEHSAWFRNQPAYGKAKTSIGKAHKWAARAIAALNVAMAAALDRMRRVVGKDAPELPSVTVTPELADEPEEAIFDSRDDFLTATRKLQRLKALEGTSEDTDDDTHGGAEEETE